MTYRVALCHAVSHRWVHWLVSSFFVFMLLTVWGCGSPIIKFGRMPETSKLETSLQPEISTRADVLKVLGVPRNSGGAMLPAHDSPRDLWVYYLEEGTFTDDRRIFLFVFFKDDRYDGYIWFSSLPGTGPGTP